MSKVAVGVPAVYRLVNSALAGENLWRDADYPTPQEWGALHQLMQQNHLSALTATVLPTLPAEHQPPRGIKLAWLMQQQQVADCYEQRRGVEREIHELSSSHGINCLTLKGSQIARHYPRPELRECGDLDLYFYNQHAAADELVSKHFGISINNDSPHHTTYSLRGIPVESHYSLLNTHYPPSNKAYERLLLSHIPSATFELLFMLRHMACHFAASRITLRDLVDWHLTTRALEKAAHWDVLAQAAADYGMSAFASALTTLVEKRFGHRIPLHTATVPVATHEAVEHDILFGSTASEEYLGNGLGRLRWKIQRYRSNRWKQHLVFKEPAAKLLVASIAAHSMKPHSILHKT